MASLTEVMAGRRRSRSGPLARTLSEDDVMLGANPIDELRRTVNTGQYTPEQAAANRAESGWEVLSNIPGPGNAISAYDAYTGARDAASAFSEGNYRDAAVSGGLSGLSALGAIAGLPVGKFAKQAAEMGPDVVGGFAGGPPTPWAGYRHDRYADEWERSARELHDQFEKTPEFGNALREASEKYEVRDRAKRGQTRADDLRFDDQPVDWNANDPGFMASRRFILQGQGDISKAIGFAEEELSRATTEAERQSILDAMSALGRWSLK